MSYVAIVPARSGSQRIKGKNTRLFAGSPLIEWTIRAAQTVSNIKTVAVSSDDSQVKRLCEQAIRGSQSGSKLTYIERPSELASNNASMSSVIRHAIESLGLFDVDNIILLQPTSPLRTAQHISEAIKMFEDNAYQNLVSVTRSSYPPEWCLPMTVSGALDLSRLADGTKRTQEYRAHYVPNGAIYISQVKNFLRTNSFYSDPCYPFIMAAEVSQDIDEESDWVLAEALFEHHCGGRCAMKK